ncbi:LPMO lytic polysaccharide monooxygenase, partial [Cladorrhinum sp. PSN259]
AHSVICNAFIDGKDQGDGQGKYIRSPPNTDPIKDISSPEINCNVKGATAVSDFISANAGDRLTFEWRRITRGDDIIDPSHSGPIITYITPFVDGQPSGGVWTKIHEEGFDSATKKWAVDKLIAQKGKWDFNLPAELKAGKYIVRQEIIALHEADKRFDQDPKRGAQFYPQCVQVEVGGSGTREPDQAFNLNTGYSVSDPGIFFNMYTKFDSYPIPGPPVWDGSSATSSGST